MSRHKFSNTDPICYVYRHVRLDLSVPFYIGIGTDNKGQYKRAYNKSNRNKMWKGVAAKSAIEVEIIAEGLTILEAWEKEKEFIALHKRKMDGGTLVNITLGGDGFNGVPITEETRLKMSLAKKGKPGTRTGQPVSEETRKKISLSGLGRSAWNKGKNLSPEHIQKMRDLMKGKMVGEKHPMWGKKMPEWLKEKLRKINTGRSPWCKGKKMTPEWHQSQLKKIRSQEKGVYQYNLNWELVGLFSSLTWAAKINKYPKGSIARCCSGLFAQYKGFTWEYGPYPK